jgi:hypothetical protein
MLAEEGRLAKNRRVVDSYLRRIGAEMSNNRSSRFLKGSGEAVAPSSSSSSCLSLNKQGTAYLPFYNMFLLVIEVPDDQPDTCVLYTMVSRLRDSDPAFAKVLAAAMKLNYLQNGTSGSTIGWEREEVNLCRSLRIHGLTQAELHDALRSFMSAAASTHEVLEAAKR